MAEIYPGGTTTIRNLEQRFKYFLVIKKSDTPNRGVKQKEYFVYKFKVSVVAKAGINFLKNHFSSSSLVECRELSDLAYSTEDFEHPDYISQNKAPLRFKMYEIPIYFQTRIHVIDLEKDLYTIGSKPPINIADI
jgi:hypothetical protein